MQRLADSYQLTLPQLLDGAGIILHRHGTPPTAELILTPGAPGTSPPWPVPRSPT
ncbi:hypothetical protein ACFZCP_44145 [Streptomyces sp. NPDC007971]|uniref:hypothetical protein n=1 Tax=Streptomyces sp. NPDC007971 TaxID=3364799 RepID=UPI0036E65596